MNDAPFLRALTDVLEEIVDGSAPDSGWVLNPGDPGLLRSLDRLSAEQASVVPPGGASIAAHVDHLRYGLELLNRWSAGEDPFGDADYSQSWRRLVVSDTEWEERRGALAAAAHQWHDALSAGTRELGHTELRGVIAGVAHLAYHLGAIRQIDRSSRGPAETGEPVR